MARLSVVIITFNEEANIGRCIDSVRAIADEIIVLDSFSTDNTVEVAKSKNAIVHQQGFAGYIEQKNCALQLASNTFVLSLDADETVDEKLMASIAAEKKEFSAQAYTMNRCSNYCGRFIRHGLWYPDKKLRLFNKSIAAWGGTNPHDKIVIAAPAQTKHLEGDLYHYSYNSIEEHIQQNNRFSTISARSMWEKGKRTNWFRIIFNPVWNFLLGYIVRLGFLDGYYGFIIAVNTAHLTFLKHTKLYQLQRNARHKKPV
jgi:glycosyltransferase involved in cell wall biosynthesis